MLRLILITCALLSTATAHASNFNATVAVGYRTLEAPRWEAVDRQFNVGIFSDVGFIAGVPLFASGGIHTSDASRTQCNSSCGTSEGQLTAIRSDVEVQEVTLGLKFMPRFGDLSVYAGAGASYLKVEVSAADGFRRARDRDSGPGLYAHAGMLWHLGLWQVGIEARQVFASRLELFDESADVDGLVFGLLIGADWGE